MEAGRVLAVTVVDEKAVSGEEAVDDVGQVSRDLSHVRIIWVRGDTRQVHAPNADALEKLEQVSKRLVQVVELCFRGVSRRLDSAAEA